MVSTWGFLFGGNWDFKTIFSVLLSPDAPENGTSKTCTYFVQGADSYWDRCDFVQPIKLFLLGRIVKAGECWLNVACGDIWVPQLSWALILFNCCVVTPSFQEANATQSLDFWEYDDLWNWNLGWVLRQVTGNGGRSLDILGASEMTPVFFLGKETLLYIPLAVQEFILFLELPFNRISHTLLLI